MVHDLFGSSGGSGVGRKGDHLRWLEAAGYSVPATFVVSFDEATALSDPGGETVRTAIAGLVRPGVSYAVRSSADVEDGAQVSFAGQFLTRLRVGGPDAVVEAVEEVVASTRSEQLAAYATHAGIDPRTIRIAVLVQEMIAPVVSGVAFSRNPVTGFDETVIEAVAGLGEQLVGEGTTPNRWVARWGAITERPASDPPLPDHIVLRVAADTRAVAERFRAPVDVEWVWDGAALHWVQLRPARPVPPLPVYSNRIAREVLPGMIAPLTWTVNTPIVNGAWVDLLTDAIGPNDLEPESLARRFAGRAYFDMGAFGRIFEAFGMPRDSLELLLGFEGGDATPSFRPSGRVWRKLPRLSRTAWSMFRAPRRLEPALAGFDTRIEVLASRDPAELGERELLARADAIGRLVAELARANIEAPLLQSMWDAMLRGAAGRAGVEPALLDPGRDDPARREADLRVTLDDLSRRIAGADAQVRASLGRDGWAGLDDGAAALRPAFEEALARFGYVSDNQNDLSRVPWSEDRDALVATALAHEPGATSPPGPTLPIHLRGIEHRASRARVLRDLIAARYARAYALFRPTFLALGGRFVRRGVLDGADDVVHLELTEVRGLVDEIDLDARALVERRRREIEADALVEPPELIVGDGFLPTTPIDGNGRLRGVGTSGGRHRGPVRVVTSLRDGVELAPGEVLVVRSSDVAWTPLFTRAGAVVTEAGGMLSHASIVARELAIPCVVSVAGATRLPNGTEVTVDGYAGEVHVEGSAA